MGEARSQKSEVRTRKPAKTFKDLIVWQKAHYFILSIYKTATECPKHELYGLVSQIRRASISIAANIAEGFHRNSNKDFMRFLSYSRSSNVNNFISYLSKPN